MAVLSRLPDILSDTLATASSAATAHGIVLINRDGSIRSCNALLQRWLGIPLQALVGRNILTLLPGLTLPYLPAEAGHYLWQKLNTVKFSANLALQDVDGRSADVAVSLDVLTLDNEQLFIGVIRYDHGRHARKRSIEDFMFGATLRDEAVAITDNNGRFEFVNDAFEAMTGYCNGEVIGKRLDDILPESGIANEGTYARLSMDGRGRQQCVSMHRKKNGDAFFFLKTARCFVEADGPSTHTILEGRDISGTVAARDRLNYLAHFDTLTGLPSRASALDRLQQEIWQAKCDQCSFSIAIIDIDEFKKINDCYGHSAGDVVLRSIAEIISSSLGGRDSIGRLSGDEFLIILPTAATTKAAAEVARKVHAKIYESIPNKEVCVPITVSIGTALYPLDGNDQQTLLEHADSAMYREKSRREQCSQSGRRSRRTRKYNAEQF